MAVRRCSTFIRRRPLDDVIYIFVRRSWRIRPQLQRSARRSRSSAMVRRRPVRRPAFRSAGHNTISNPAGLTIGSSGSPVTFSLSGVGSGRSGCAWRGTDDQQPRDRRDLPDHQLERQHRDDDAERRLQHWPARRHAFCDPGTDINDAWWSGGERLHALRVDQPLQLDHLGWDMVR